MQSDSGNECGKFCIMFIQSNIKTNLIISNFYYNLKKMIYHQYAIHMAQLLTTWNVND